MNKFILCSFLFCLCFLVIVRLLSMPESTEMPTEIPAQPTTETLAQPTAEMPAQPTTVQQPSEVMPSTQPTAATVTTAEEIKPEQLGEFQLDENQPEIVKDKDPNIRKLVNKSNELSKQINDIAKQINETHDKAFNRFSEINNLLDAFYQKIGFESGRAQELLKEQK